MVRLLRATSHPMLLACVQWCLFSCLLLSQLWWDGTSPSSPHLSEMGLSMPGYSVFNFTSLECAAWRENRSLKNLMGQDYRTHEKNSRIMK